MVITTELPLELRETTDKHHHLLIETLLRMLVEEQMPLEAMRIELPEVEVAIEIELPEVIITKMPMGLEQFQQHRDEETIIIYSEEILCVEQEEEQHQHRPDHGLETTHQLALEQELEESEEILKK